ncbi:hypothetical protein ABZ345_47235 [Lentzea sp. NPDC005914]|uniref:hypothetical protein n=1 Tax=Lentzea sp. NPDC005914 TaxID=3154572 RepID=UPI0033D93355
MNSALDQLRPTAVAKRLTSVRLGRLSAAAIAVAATVGLAVAAAPAAQAGGPYKYASGMDASNHTRAAVCAADLSVRHSRGGSAFNYLYKYQTFEIWGVDAEFGSEWVYGFAYGNVNAPGYVQNGWFC